MNHLDAERPGKPSVVEAIREDLIALSLATEVGAAPKLAEFLSLLATWNATYNLTAIKDPSQMRVQHLVDCLSIVPSLRRRFDASTPIRVLDVGSGAGLPGVILAILHPAWRIDCIDAVGKKAAFVQQAAGHLGLSPQLRSFHRRVEDHTAGDQGYDLVVSRAFSTLAVLVDRTHHLLKPQGVWAAMKGKVPEDEIRHLPQTVTVQAIETIELIRVDFRRCIVWIDSKR